MYDNLKNFAHCAKNFIKLRKKPYNACLKLTINTGCVSEFRITVPAARPDGERLHFHDTMRKSSEDFDPLSINTDTGKFSTKSPPASAFGGLFLSVIWKEFINK